MEPPLYPSRGKSILEHFVLCYKTNDTSQFFREIVRLGGLPTSIVLDRNVKFHIFLENHMEAI